jgi:ankyrin repeat protein
MMSALLYEALDVWPPTVLHRRYILRDKIRSEKEKTISLLLAKGADPFASTAGLDSDLDEEEEGIPLTVAAYTGDIISFRLFLQHARNCGMDIMPILANTERYGGYSALQRSIYSDARDIFFLLVEEFPSLLNEVGEHGRRPLHSAATQEWPGYVAELVRRGASPYDRSRDRSTPFSWALMRNHNLEVAKLLADSCDDMGPILGPDEQSGFTCFGKVLSGIIVDHMDYGVERLRYLVEKFGTPDFFCCVNPNGWHNTVFRTVLLQKTSPSDRVQIALEMSVLEFLLEVFPDKVDFIDFSGKAPLHYAAIYGNHAAVEVLLRLGADPKLETTSTHVSLDPSQSKGFIGYTALDLAAKYQRNGPGAEVLRGGQRDIQEWESNMQQIIRDLVAAGDGESGSGVSLQNRLLASMAAGRLRNFHLGSSKSRGPSLFLPS